MNRFASKKKRGNLFRLADPDLAQIQVRCSLAATLQIPIRGTVTNQDNLHNVILEQVGERKANSLPRRWGALGSEPWP